VQMSDAYVEVRLAAVVDSGELIGFLPRNEAIGAWESEGTIHLYWRSDRWSPLVLEDLEWALRRLGSGGESAGISVEQVADQDWNETWLRSIKPVLIGSRVFVRQSWNTEQAPPGSVELVVDPRRAFGSGYHATTQLVVEWLSEAVHGGESVLDIGTGSGILAMAALRLGATKAVGIDNDSAAIECATENAALNRFGPELQFVVGSIANIGAATFDLIVANIDRSSLLASAGGLGRYLCRDGRLFLSGLQAEDLADISSAIEISGGRVRQTQTREEWLAVEVEFESGR
jgi:ribosomal protein L11 methyltransferase